MGAIFLQDLSMVDEREVGAGTVTAGRVRIEGLFMVAVEGEMDCTCLAL